MMMTGKSRFSWLLLCLTLTGFTALADETPTTYTFGVFPYLSAVRLEAIYAPVSAELSKELGVPIHFRTASHFKTFFNRLSQQRYDIALIQPFWYPPAVDKFGYLPLVRMVEPFTASVLVLDSSPLTRASDLRGKIVATPPAFVPVVQMARRALQERGLDPDRDLEMRAFKNVDSCFQQVLIGSASACIAPPFAPAVFEEKMHVKFRVILETPALPNLSLVVHSRVPAEQRERLKRAFLSWRETDEGRRLLHSMRSAYFVPAQDKDYNSVRSFLAELAGGR